VIAMFFEKIKKAHRNKGVQKDSETLLLKTVFNIAGGFGFKVAKKCK
jgi:hypothetical protein